MITGDTGTRLAGVLRAGADSRRLPVAAAGLSSAGTWRPAPAENGGGPGTYATSLPFALARLTGTRPWPLAELMASQLAGESWISTARVTGAGYLTVTVTRGHLTGLAARIVAAGPGAAGSDSLAGACPAPPRLPGLARAAGSGAPRPPPGDGLRRPARAPPGGAGQCFHSAREGTPRLVTP